MSDIKNDLGYINFLKTQTLVEYLKNLQINQLDTMFPLIYKICSNLQTNEEIDKLAQFVNKVYESGYYKSVEDHKKALEVHGLNTNINL
jgi:hypothetical protein